MQVGVSGVQTQVRCNGKLIEIAIDGQLPIDEPATLNLGLLIDGHNRKVFLVDGNKKIIEAVNRSQNPDADAYRRKIAVMRDDDGLFTRYVDNNLRILDWNENGVVSIYEFAIVCHDGKSVYLTVQNPYIAQCYRAGKKIACPRLAKWPSLMAMLPNLFNGSAMKLPEIEVEHKDVSTNEKDSAIKDGIGRVIWYNLAMGCGLIKTVQGDALVHYSQVEQKNGLTVFDEGQLVAYKATRIVHTDKGRRLNLVGVASL